MWNYFKNLFKKKGAVGEVEATATTQADARLSELTKKVEKGTQKALKEYGYVFKKLAEFDRA